VDLLTSLALAHPKQPRKIPTWDLVLKVLTTQPFEPAVKADLNFWGYKTAFLLALATASRVSDLHAKDVDSIRFGERYTDVSFAPALGFLSKTQSPEDTQRALARVSVKSLCESVHDRMEEDKSLCPVQALRLYLKKTAPYRGSKKRLFLSSLAETHNFYGVLPKGPDLHPRWAAESRHSLRGATKSLILLDVFNHTRSIVSTTAPCAGF
jgi:hypothetical protein